MLGVVHRRIGREIRLHQMMRASMQVQFGKARPVQGPEQRRVLRLDVGQESRAAAGMGRGDGDLDQPGPERGRAAERPLDGEA